jgi:iron complex transport system permease protein
MLRNNKLFIPALMVLLVITLLAAIAFGAVNVPAHDMGGAILHYFTGQKPANIREGVFLQLRLPRVLLCATSGAILAASGVLMQGLFRNPVVEPGLVGTSSGAAFGASIVFVLAASLQPELKTFFTTWMVPVFAFGGALLATFAVYILSAASGNVSVFSLLLVGIAINAMGLSGTGFMSYIARDPQARSITFWNLGTFSASMWWQVWITLATGICCLLVATRFTRQLNALMLGEAEATYLGVNPGRLKKKIMLLNTAMVAVVTAFAGVIGFMGLMVPHLVRLLIGSDNRKLLPASILAGAILLTWADMGARLFLAPAEIPVGIITALVGSPVFIMLLRRSYWVMNKGGTNA